MTEKRSYSPRELQKIRARYYGAQRKVNTLEKQKSDLMKVLSNNRISLNGKSDSSSKTRPITTAERSEYRRRLGHIKFLLVVAKDDLKEKRYAYKNATRTNLKSTQQKLKNLKQKKEENRIEKALKIIRKLQTEDKPEFNYLKDTVKNGSSSPNSELGRKMLPVIRKHNKGLPITRLSDNSITSIKKLLNGGSDETSD